MIYLLGGVVFFLGTIPFVLKEADDTFDCILLLGLAVMAAFIWPLALLCAGIIGLGKLLGCF